MTLEKLKELAMYSAKKTAPANFSVNSVNQAIQDGLKELAGSVNMFMKIDTTFIRL